MKKRTGIIIVIVFIMILFAVIGVGVKLESLNPPEVDHQQYVKEYLENNTDLSPEVRTAILNGKVILGMYPDEAQAAAGQFAYCVEADPKWGRDYFPPKVIFSQKGNPDNSKIEMTFWTTTQFDTEERISFTVIFEKGKAVKIERNN